jgi:hypothetical protein
MRRASSFGHGASCATGGFSCHHPYGTNWIATNAVTSTANGQRAIRHSLVRLAPIGTR